MVGSHVLALLFIISQTRVEKKEGRCRVGGARSMRHQASGSHASMLPRWLGTRDLTRCFGVRPRQRDVQSSPGRYHKIYGLFVRSEKIQKKSISEKTTAQSRWLRGSQHCSLGAQNADRSDKISTGHTLKTWE